MGNEDGDNNMLNPIFSKKQSGDVISSGNGSEGYAGDYFVIRYDHNRCIVSCNAKLQALWGLTASEVVGKTLKELCPNGRFDELDKMIGQVLASAEDKTYFMTQPIEGDADRYIHFYFMPESDEQGNVIGILGIGHDVSQLKETERQLATILDNHPDIIIRYDKELHRVYANHTYEKISRNSVLDSVTQTHNLSSVIMASITDSYFDKLKEVLETGEKRQFEPDWLGTDGIRRCYEIRMIPEHNSLGEVSSVVTIARDVLDIQQANELLTTQGQDFHSQAENPPDMIVRYDQNYRQIFVNGGNTEYTGPSIEAAHNSCVDDVSMWGPTMSAKEYHGRLARVMKSGKADKVLLEWRRSDGVNVSHEMYVLPEYDMDGKVIGALALGRDVTRRKQIEKQLQQQASYDTLTGLPNRRLLSEYLEHDLEQSENNVEGLGLLFVNLDRFKVINDSMGHEIGDKLLKRVTQRIKHLIRDSDMIARFTDDEFVVVLSSNNDVNVLTRVANSIAEAIAQPLYLEQHHIHITACIGIAAYPQNASSPDELIQCAEQAMHAAKKMGSNNIRFYNNDVLLHAQHSNDLANDLYQALDNGELEVYYQPIINVKTGQTIKAEALLRWHHPELGMLLPDQFIPLAEETDLIQEIGNWVFCKASEVAEQWNSFVESDVIHQISVNISPRQFSKGDAGDAGAKIINCSNLNDHDPAQIAIEITEGVLLDACIDTVEKLDSLRDAGFEISLDDFGTGYSAMAYLKTFNIDYLKIDRSFISDLERDSAAQAIAESIIVMARRLGLKVIAEGVETSEQYAILAEMDCEYMQGYLFAKPMSLPEFIEFVDREVCAIQA